MQKILLKTFFFLLPVFVLTLGIEMLIRNIPNEYKLKNDFMDLYAADVECLALGSSHVFRGFNPSFSSLKSFNAAMVSQSLDYDLAIYNKYKNDLNNLEYLILPASYMTYFSSLHNGKESWRQKNYPIYWGISLSFSLKNELEILNFDLNTNLERIANFYINNEDVFTCDSLGYGYWNNKNYAVNDENAAAAVSRHTKSDSTLSEDLEKKIHNLLKFAKSKNIKVIFLSTPVSSYYSSKIDQKQYEKMETITNTFIKQYSNAYHLNLFYNEEFNHSDFYNADHLNEAGAIKLTKKINSFIKTI